MTDPKLAISTPNGRHYQHPHRQIANPSITNVKDVKNVPGLKFWAAREAATYAADNLEKLAPLDREERIALIKGAPFKSTSKKAESSRVGDVVHDWVDRAIQGEVITDEEILHPTVSVKGKPEPLSASATRTAQNMWRQFAGWRARNPQDCLLQHYQPQWWASEFTVWSDTWGYAGTADWAAMIGGAMVLGDTKTGERIYPDFRYQLAALAHADFILKDDGTEVPLPKFDRYGILHVRPTYYKLIPYSTEAVDSAFEAFKAMITIWRDDRNYEENTILFAPKMEVRAATSNRSGSP